MNDGRYSRQELFAGIGVEGQRRIAASHVLIVGAGALGTANAESLVRAGIGRLTIVDRDYVEWSNLQRQQLYGEEDAAQKLPKAIAACRRLKQINSQTVVDARVSDLTTANIREAGRDADLIIDATDNFDTRMLINDFSQQQGIPWIYGACVASYGITFTIIPGETPCLGCLLETVPLGGMTCDTAGIVGPVVQTVAAQQSAEALKLMVGDRASLRGKLLSFDLWQNRQTAVDVMELKRQSCPSCGTHRTYPYLTAANHPKAAVLCGRDSVQIRPSAAQARNLPELGEALSAAGYQVEQNPFLLSFHAEDRRIVVFADGRVLIHGTKDVSSAKSLYHRLLG